MIFIARFVGSPLTLTLTTGLMALFVKVPLLWCKTSLASLTWPCLAAADKAEIMFAIGLAWYSLAPVFEELSHIYRKMLADGSLEYAENLTDRLLYFVLPAIGFALGAVLLIHLFGVLGCSSHDFAVLSLRCTPEGPDLCGLATNLTNISL